MATEIREAEIFTTPRYLAVYAPFGRAGQEGRYFPTFKRQSINNFAGLRPPLDEEIESLVKTNKLDKIVHGQHETASYGVPADLEEQVTEFYDYLAKSYGGSVVRFEQEFSAEDTKELLERGVEIVEVL